MRVGFFELEPGQAGEIGAALARLGIADRVDATYRPGALDAASAAGLADLEAACIFIGTRLDRPLLDRLPGLRLVLTRSTGYDHIDLARCRERGIVVCNVPRYGTTTVAEHTFALMLGLSRKVHEAVTRTRHDDFTIEGLRGFDLYGKTLGVVGTGSIGLHVIRIARGFGMNVLAHDVRPQPLLAEVLQFRYVDLDTLLRESDVVTLHVPALPETRHLIGREALGKMKPGALLINTARGQVVDTDAVLAALRRGTLGGVGLDVVEGEEHIREDAEVLVSEAASEAIRQVFQTHLLLHHDNVLFTPHIAFNSVEAIQRILDTTLGNLKAYLEGAPANVVA